MRWSIYRSIENGIQHALNEPIVQFDPKDNDELVAELERLDRILQANKNNSEDSGD